ncbi:hypothetical protein [Janthinobacterium sp.]|uniref:hypothetical protein n=1 Tax=Janthinobacterium sp. TaxID=1871054 RepID=UPI00293D54F4|nr:hypothetical protein [Janthinobacterium sp.]
MRLLLGVGVGETAPVQHQRERIEGRAPFQDGLQTPRGDGHEGDVEQQRHEIGGRHVQAGDQAAAQQIDTGAAVDQGGDAAGEHHQRLQQHQGAEEITGKMPFAVAQHQPQLEQIKHQHQGGEQGHARGEIRLHQQIPGQAGQAAQPDRVEQSPTGAPAVKQLRADHRQTDARHQRGVRGQPRQPIGQDAAQAEQRGGGDQEQQAQGPVADSLHLGAEAAIDGKHDDAHHTAHQGCHQQNRAEVE